MSYQISKATTDRAAFLRAEARRLAKVRDKFDEQECSCSGTGLVVAPSGLAMDCVCKAIQTACAWCDKEDGIVRPLNTSHGICAKHDKAMRAQMKRERAIYLNKRAYVESGFEGTFEEWERMR